MRGTASRTFIAGLAAALAAATAVPAVAAPQPAAGPGTASTYSFGVIGDTPYGQQALADFPGQIQQMNQDRSLSFVAHVGDIKAGSQRCDDSYYQQIRSDFDTFRVPLVFTPGDNDWTDCHRANNGAYDPLERMGALREIFFDQPGRTLGGKNLRIDDEAAAGYPENGTFRQRQLSFAVINEQGSNNGLEPWTGLGQTEPNAAQLAEEQARVQSNLTVIDRAFDQAEQRHDRAVVILQQADMFDADVKDPTAETQSGHQQIVDRIAERSRGFDGPVYLINGDSHEFTADQPLAAGSKWLEVYGQQPVENLQRITVDGASDATNYTRFTVLRPQPGAAGHGGEGIHDVLSWEKVPFQG